MRRANSRETDTGRMAVIPKVPKATSDAVSRSMKGNKSKGTGPELLMGRLVWAAGIRGYRKNDPRVPGKPDLYFPKLRLAVFLNGCFWHRCPYCKLSLPKSNADFWQAKFTGNKLRDIAQKRNRDKIGIRTFIVWECQLTKTPDGIMERLFQLIEKQRTLFE
jgi:DNA mismatch endonuclease (patch repair protein)